MWKYETTKTKAIQHLRAYEGSKTIKQLSDKLKIPVKRLYKLRTQIGLSCQVEMQEEEKDIVLGNYKTMSNSQLHSLLTSHGYSRTIGGISLFLCKRGLTRTQRQLDKIAKTKHVSSGSKNHKVGDIIIRRCKEGDLYVSYRYIKMTNGMFKRYHRFVWEQENGKIPMNKMVSFLDGDTLNCNINNLKLIAMSETVLNKDFYYDSQKKSSRTKRSDSEEDKKVKVKVRAKAKRQKRNKEMASSKKKKAKRKSPFQKKKEEMQAMSSQERYTALKTQVDGKVRVADPRNKLSRYLHPKKYQRLVDEGKIVNNTFVYEDEQ